MSAVAWSIVLASLLVSVAVTGWVRRQALRRQWLDVPNERSSHDAPTPRGGGLGIVVATGCGFVALWATGLIPGDLCVALLGGGLACAVTGFRDDRKPLGAGLRLAVHMGAAAWALAWLGGVQPMQVGASTYDLGIVGNLLGALAIGWTINLFNFMDGIDGLAAGEAVFIAGAGALLSSVRPPPQCRPQAWCSPPRHSGFSAGTGLRPGSSWATSAAATSVSSSQCLRLRPCAIRRCVVFAWLVLGGVFFVDATVTLARRMARGERAHEAHRSHAYQWLARAWGSHRPVTLAILLFNAWVLLPVAGFCVAYPQLAFVAATATLVALVPLALVARRRQGRSAPGFKGVNGLAENRSDHRHHRPGRRLPGRVPAGQGLRGPRHQAPRLARSTPTASTTSTRTRTSRTRGFILHYGDLTDSTNLIRIIQQVQPDEIYNLAAQSHVAVSFETPEYTANADALGTLRLLEAIRILGLEKKTRFYQASTSEMYGKVQEMPQTRDHAVLPALALRRGQALRLLDHGELPRGLRHVRLQRHPVQPRVAAPRRDLRHAQDHARRWRASSWACRSACTSATSTRSATGATRATTSRRSG